MIRRSLKWFVLISLVFYLAACSQNPVQLNTMPVVRATDQTVTLGEQVQLDASASSDPDGDRLRYLWTFETKPEASQAVLQNADQAKASFTADVEGNYQLNVAVSDGEKSASTSIVVTVLSDTFSAEVDTGLEPDTTSLPAFKDGKPRPVAAARYNDGVSAAFISNELILATDDTALLDDFVKRWNGEVLLSINPSEGMFQVTPRYIVRIETARANSAHFDRLLAALAPAAAGKLLVSSQQGLELIVAAASEQLAGLSVDMNWLMTSQSFNDRSSLEGSGLDAFSLDYMTTGSNQNTGVAEAWLALERAGKLGNKVSVAVIDGGFAPNSDFPAATQSFTTGSGNATNTPNPTNCSGGSSCPWHGTGAANTIAGLADNGYGGAGSAGPIAKLVTVHTSLDHGSVMDALGIVASRASIISMSFGGQYSGTWAWWTLDGYADYVQAVSRNGNMMFAAAGNGEGTPLVGVDIDAGETKFDDPTIYAPCEFVGVTCIGALANNSNQKIGYSNFGSISYDSDIYSHGTVDYFASTNISVGDYPNSSAPQTFGGTSAATPFAAGIAALVKAADPTLTAFEVNGILSQTANTGSSDARVTRWLNAKAAVLQALGDDSPPYLQVTSPSSSSFLEGQTINLEATIDDLDTPEKDYTISWFYQDYKGTRVGLGSTKSGQALAVDWLCDGRYELSAETILPGAPSAQATVSVAVTNPAVPPAACAPSVYITSPSAGATFAVGDTVTFRAEFDDDHPETDNALYPIIWREGGPDGLIIARDTLSFSRNKFSEGEQEIYVEYGTASDRISIRMVATTNSRPSVSIRAPEDDRILFWQDYINTQGTFFEVPFNGLVQDVEDGVLAENQLQWFYREVGQATWKAAGTGSRPVIELPIVSPGASYEIRLTATDSGGLTGEAVIEIAMVGPAS